MAGIQAGELAGLLFRSFLYISPLYRVRKNRLNRDILLICLFTFLVWLVNSAGSWFAKSSAVSGSSFLLRILPQLIMALINLLDWGLIFFTCRKSASMSLLCVLFVDIFIQTSFAIVRSAGSLIAYSLAEGVLIQTGTLSYTMQIPLGECALSVLAVYLLRRFLKRYTPQKEDMKWLLIAALIVMHFNHVILSHYIFRREEIIDNLIVMCGFLLMPQLILVLFFKMVQNAELRVREQSSRRIMEMNKSRLAQLKMNDDLIIRTKHDIAAHLNLLRSFLEKGQYESAELYLKKTGGLLDDESLCFYCANPYINAVIHYEKMNHPCFQFDVLSEIPGECGGIDPIDLGILIMNLIDQRIAAIQRNHLKQKISLKLTQREKILCVRIDSEMNEDMTEEETMSGQIEKSVIENILSRYKGKMHYGVHSATDQAVMFSIR